MPAARGARGRAAVAAFGVARMTPRTNLLAVKGVTPPARRQA